MKAKIQIYQDRQDKYRVKLLAGNGKNIMNAGESYESKQGVKGAVKRLQQILPDAKLEDKTLGKKK